MTKIRDGATPSDPVTLSPSGQWVMESTADKGRSGGEPQIVRLGRRVPTDARSLLLLAGYLGLLIVGVINLFEADWSGLVPIAAAIAGIAFLRGRLLNLVVWLGVFAYGLAALSQLDFAGVVPVGLGLLGAIVAAWPDKATLESLRPAATISSHDRDDEEEAEVPLPTAELTIRTVGRLEFKAAEAPVSTLLFQGVDYTQYRSTGGSLRDIAHEYWEEVGACP